MFVLENLNPKKSKSASDCVIRAIAKAEGKTWFEIFDILTELARQNCSVLNNTKIYSKYLEKYETVPVMHMVDGKKKRYTVEEISSDLPIGTYIVSVAGHLTVVVNGNYYDTWDCGEKSSYKIWKVV